MKITFNVPERRLFAFLSIVILVCSFAVGVYYGRSSWTGALESLLWQAGAPQPCSYIITTNGTHYFMFNGTTGYPDYIGTNASQTINNAFGNITAFPPQKVVILVGNFTLDAPIVVHSYTYVDAYQAVLILDESVETDMIQFASGCVMSEWHGGLLIGNGS